MKSIFFFIIISLVVNSCSTVRQSAGVTRKSADEFKIIENPPLVLPPDFSLKTIEQLEKKDVNNLDKDLAKEVLFGLDIDQSKTVKKSSTMSEILSNSNSNDVSDSIREEIDEDFAQEISTDNIFQYKWNNERDVLDTIKESERIRNLLFEGKPLGDGAVSIKKETIKIKKKKRFIFF